MVAAVTDGPRLSLTGRALAPLAVALTLLWSGTNAQPDMAGMPPRQPTVRATPQLPHGILAGQMSLVRAAAGHGQRNRRDGTPAAALAAVLAGALAGVIRSLWGVGSRQPDRRRGPWGRALRRCRPDPTAGRPTRCRRPSTRWCFPSRRDGPPMATKTPGSASAQTEALGQLAAFPLVEALFGRRSRRFALGGEIPDGPLAYRSRHQPMPLDELERLLVLTAMGGTTGWHYSITRHARYAPHVSNYAAAAGRTFPSAAGFHTAELFFTDDSGVWFFPTRDAGALVDPAVERVTPELMVQRHRGRLRQLAEGRLYLPAAEPYLEGHNTWCVNVPGSLLVIPVADIAQHLLAILCFFAQNGYGIYDDVNRRPIPGLEQFRGLVDVEEPVPLTFAEQYALTEATAELACACYAGVLVLQAMGLGGITGTWRRRWRPLPSASSARAAPSIPTPRGPGPTAPGSGAAPRSMTRRSRPVWPCRPSTSWTPSASSPAPCPPCSSSTTSRPTT
jgi:hypothetical protein